jgi:hypothetical protein
MASRRSYGSGRVYVRTDSAGRETYYGSWWMNGRRVNRRLGAKRVRGSREGLTAARAEAELRRLIREVAPSAKRRSSRCEGGRTALSRAPDGAWTQAQHVDGG